MQIQIVDDGQVVAVEALTPFEFKSGSKGYRANGRVTAASGTRFQLGLNLVEIGTKPKTGK